jgi:hypothetical protein
MTAKKIWSDQKSSDKSISVNTTLEEVHRKNYLMKLGIKIYDETQL